MESFGEIVSVNGTPIGSFGYDSNRDPPVSAYVNSTEKKRVSFSERVRKKNHEDSLEFDSDLKDSNSRKVYRSPVGSAESSEHKLKLTNLFVETQEDNGEFGKNFGNQSKNYSHKNAESPPMFSTSTERSNDLGDRERRSLYNGQETRHYTSSGSRGHQLGNPTVTSPTSTAPFQNSSSVPFSTRSDIGRTIATSFTDENPANTLKANHRSNSNEHHFKRNEYRSSFSENYDPKGEPDDSYIEGSETSSVYSNYDTHTQNPSFPNTHEKPPTNIGHYGNYSTQKYTATSSEDADKNICRNPEEPKQYTTSSTPQSNETLSYLRQIEKLNEKIATLMQDQKVWIQKDETYKLQIQYETRKRREDKMFYETEIHRRKNKYDSLLAIYQRSIKLQEAHDENVQSWQQEKSLLIESNRQLRSRLDYIYDNVLMPEIEFLNERQPSHEAQKIFAYWKRMQVRAETHEVQRVGSKAQDAKFRHSEEKLDDTYEMDTCDESDLGVVEPKEFVRYDKLTEKIRLYFEESRY
ncbi:hypothetical protein CANARDRAFT_21639 [[Candida] arabinofermentans NRRL YB-2248]|uniref:Uncharacterized protein n=1 Tax=[Candida] arabinofermentans NRRL YB-2248 TaxID=983967 RepID=A0A1E4T4G7_9ASCO|nr:hypothetical protein CANARDRAFT_21639 [[Candida] arabinofermentans NRRL YB-2248]